ncbi:sterol desaturase family protein [Marinomonas transparens]|uniref:Sterol desaturase family protein n=1 Tax=Marinomonas transparens TaxID=2795388 RepID=A0A934JSY9_9GAMM|nr:sterol desaturase family protein [Marinomonas transparens]MBJ7539414.1 sterol desaturase family protein [Marinomonas transparens]
MEVAFGEWLLSVVSQAGQDFFNMQKRVSVWYILSAILFAWLLLGLRYGRQVKARMATLFSPQIWWHSSARMDYGVFLLNRFVMALLIPLLPTKIILTSWVFFQSHQWFGSFQSFSLPTPWVIASFTFCYFIVDDFSRFYLHRLLHKWPILWAFHSVHHSAQVMTPMTVFRTHPIEGVLFFLRSLVVQALCIGVFVFLFPNQVSLYTVFSVSIFTYFFNLLGANLRHSHVSISYGRTLEKVFISPAQHQRHHSSSVKDYDCNFGVVLAIWDRFFGSLRFGHDDQKITFGTQTVLDKASFVGLYILPCKNAGRQLIEPFKALWRKRV